MEMLRATALIVATMTVGLMAGVFALYANTIMPGLRRTDDRTFVGGSSPSTRRSSIPCSSRRFFGALVFTGLAVVLHLGEHGRSVLPWIVVALLLYLAVFVITVRVNVPLNDRIKAAGAPDRIPDLAWVRQQFDEPRWVRWNLVRALTTTIAFGCLAWALVLLGAPQRRAGCNAAGHPCFVTGVRRCSA